MKFWKNKQIFKIIFKKLESEYVIYIQNFRNFRQVGYINFS